MAATIEYTEKANDYFITIAEINALFAAIKVAVDGKMDRRGFTALGTINTVGTTILNVPEPTAAGDLERI